MHITVCTVYFIVCNITYWNKYNYNIWVRWPLVGSGPLFSFDILWNFTFCSPSYFLPISSFFLLIFFSFFLSCISLSLHILPFYPSIPLLFFPPSTISSSSSLLSPSFASLPYPTPRSPVLPCHCSHSPPFLFHVCTYTGQYTPSCTGPLLQHSPPPSYCWRRVRIAGAYTVCVCWRPPPRDVYWLSLLGVPHPSSPSLCALWYCDFLE